MSVAGFFKDFASFAEKEISTLVALFFFVFAAGEMFAYYIILRGLNPLWLFVPIILGVFAYYEKGLAVFLGVILIAVFFL